MRSITVSSLLAVCTFGVAASATAAPSITVYLSNPDAVAAPGTFTNLVTETFDTIATPTGVDSNGYVSPVGTYSGTPFAVVADNQFGSGTGNYFAIGTPANSAGPLNLTFSTPISYFGLSYNAGDSANGFTFYDNTNAFLARFATSDLIGFLNNGVGTVTATNGSQYNTSSYFGKPVTGENALQPYSFVNFFFTGGTVGRIAFDNSGNSTTAGFESDSHTISTSTQNPTGTPLVFVTSVAVVPETNTLALLALVGVPALGAIVGRRRK